MGTIKKILTYTNPLVLLGIPVLVGIIISAMFDGVTKKTIKVCKEVNKDL